MKLLRGMIGEEIIASVPMIDPTLCQVLKLHGVGERLPDTAIAKRPQAGFFPKNPIILRTVLPNKIPNADHREGLSFRESIWSMMDLFLSSSSSCPINGSVTAPPLYLS